MADSSVLKPQLPDRALELIGSKREGLLQSELRKLLGIESSKCSKIVSKLMQFRANKTAQRVYRRIPHLSAQADCPQTKGFSRSKSHRYILN